MSDFRLRVFQVVARHLSFTKAAQELFVTQPVVTKHIHELERTHCQRLLERSGNRIALTEAGRLLLVRAVGVRPYVLGVVVWVVISVGSLSVILHGRSGGVDLSTK